LAKLLSDRLKQELKLPFTFNAKNIWRTFSLFGTLKLK
jgi:hypothetical protein